MTLTAKHSWPLAILAVLFFGILTLTLKPYDWNPSALFHLDQLTADTHGIPKNMIVLQMPGYDGEQYYQIARKMRDVFDRSHWPLLANTPTIAYSYQRFLLPLFAFGLSLGREAWLPYAFLAIQLISLLTIGYLMLKQYPKKPLYAWALALCPAALIGLHFSLAEPLTLALLTTFLLRFGTRNTLRTFDIILLSLFVLTREVNILFIGVLLLYLLWSKRWRDAVLLIIPIGSFFALHTLIYGIFAEIPFFWSADKRTLPFTAILDILQGLKGYNIYTLSSVALFLGFVLPAFLWSASNIIRRNEEDFFLPLASFIFLCLMLAMPDHIWGSITSIGRVITPVYPLVLLQAAERDTLSGRLIAIGILLLGVGASISLALIVHPYALS
jgi:hypothetical protein